MKHLLCGITSVSCQKIFLSRIQDFFLIFFDWASLSAEQLKLAPEWPSGIEPTETHLDKNCLYASKRAFFCHIVFLFSVKPCAILVSAYIYRILFFPAHPYHYHHERRRYGITYLWISKVLPKRGGGAACGRSRMVVDPLFATGRAWISCLSAPCVSSSRRYCWKASTVQTRTLASTP